MIIQLNSGMKTENFFGLFLDRMHILELSFVLHLIPKISFSVQVEMEQSSVGLLIVLAKEHSIGLSVKLAREEFPSFVYCPDNSYLCIGSSVTSKLRVVKVARNKNNGIVCGDHKEISHHSMPITSLHYHNNLLYTGSQDKTVGVWNTKDWKLTKVIKMSAWDGLQFYDYLMGAYSSKLTISTDETDSVTFDLPSSINCLQMFEGRLYVGTGKHGVLILDDQESRLKRWLLTKTLLIAKFKNSSSLFSSMPVEIIHLIVHFVYKRSAS